MPNADYLKFDGDWNANCDRCGFKFKASKLKEEWTGFMVCKECWEPRHPQDFLRGVPDDPSVPWTRPDFTYGEQDRYTDVAGNSLGTTDQAYYEWGDRNINAVILDEDHLSWTVYNSNPIHMFSTTFTADRLFGVVTGIGYDERVGDVVTVYKTATGGSLTCIGGAIADVATKTIRVIPADVKAVFKMQLQEGNVWREVSYTPLTTP